MNLDEYRSLDAVAMASLIRKGEITATEAAQAALEVAGQWEPSLNALVETYPDRATDDHTAALADGPLSGVPFLVKDLGNMEEGKACDMGSRLGQGFVPDHPSTLMERFRAAGLNTLGRATTPEFGLNAATESVQTGPTRNPWDQERGAGGSSGGSAAAVAAGYVPMAHASDGGGSIRIPAACCGLFGLKPTRGRVPTGPDAAYPIGGFANQFAVSRSVRDSAALLDAVAGPALGDPFEIGPPAGAYLDEVATAPGRLRVAWSAATWSGQAIDPTGVAGVEATARLCEELGHQVTEEALSFDYEPYLDATITIWTTSLSFRLDGVAAARGRRVDADTVEAATLASYEHGKSKSSDDYLQAQSMLNRMARSVAPFWDRYDVLLTPTMAGAAPPLGASDQNDPRFDVRSWFEHVFGVIAPFTAPFNSTGQPAMSVPLAEDEAGRPVGMQFVGRFGDDATLFRLAGQLQEARPWADRLPALG